MSLTLSCSGRIWHKWVSSWPSSPAPVLAAGYALERAYGALRKDGSSRAIAGELYEFEAFSRLMGFEAVWEFDRAHAAIQPADKPA